MLSKIGIDASIVVQEYPVWVSGTYKGNYEGLVHIPTWTLGDEDEWLATYTPGDTRNQIHINDPKITQLVHGAEADGEEHAHGEGVAREAGKAGKDQRAQGKSSPSLPVPPKAGRGGGGRFPWFTKVTRSL